MTLGFDFIGNRLGACGALAVCPSLTSLEDLVSLFSTLSKPIWVFTIGKFFPEMFHFFLKKLRIATNSFGPVHESTNDTIFT